MTDIKTLKTALASVPLVPVLTIDRGEDAAPLAIALARGGFKAVEVILRTSAALPAITAMREAAPDLMVGAGMVTDPDEVASAVDVGAQFLASPGLSPQLSDALLATDIPAIPGVMTISEAMTCAANGFDILKLFPATSINGLDLLHAWSVPLSNVDFIAGGGITADHAKDYLSLSNVCAVGGSWMVNRTDIAIGDWTSVEGTASAAVAACRQ
ncbi:MAG: bifunctional 4-hydroxy-2-oxoglutarate aldolase/2-dehydro-3-deoxy-phosphogluconate aldolase [Pseudomonadota bacterium]